MKNILSDIEGAIKYSKASAEEGKYFGCAKDEDYNTGYTDGLLWVMGLINHKIEKKRLDKYSRCIKDIGVG